MDVSFQAACLPTNQQAMFALLVPSCQLVWNHLLTVVTTLIVDIISRVARLFQQVRHSHDITILLQPCVNLVTFLLYHDCIRPVIEQPYNRSDNAIKLATSYQ